MAVTAESSNSLYIEEQDFNQLVWNKVSYWTFLAVYTILLQRNIQLENLLLYNFFFQVLNCKSTKEYCFVALDIEFDLMIKLLKLFYYF